MPPTRIVVFALVFFFLLFYIYILNVCLYSTVTSRLSET